MHLNLIRSRSFAVLAAFALALPAQAAEIQWNVSHGGDMQEDSNWRTGAKPAVSDYIKIARKNDAPITLSDDLTATGGNSTFSANFELALTNSTGEAKTLALKRVTVSGAATTERLTAGTLSFTDGFYLGSNSTSDSGETFFVDGQTAVLTGTSLVSVGPKCPDSTMIVTNGASLTGAELYVGRESRQFGTAWATNECLFVSGAGTVAGFTKEAVVGCAGGNRIEVSDNAEMTVAAINIGHCSHLSNTTSLGVGEARIVVSGGASLTVTNGASVVGQHTRSNLLAVVDGGRLVCVTNQLRVGNNVQASQTFAALSPGYALSGNRMLVSGAGSSVTLHGSSNAGIWIGSAVAPDCSVVVENGAQWTSRGVFKMADAAVTNASVLVATGASLVHGESHIYVGTGDASTNATFTIDGGTVTIEDGYGVVVRSRSGRLVVANGGKATVGGDVRIGVASGGQTYPDARLSLSGTSSAVSVGGTLQLGETGTFVVEIPVGGFSDGAPPVTCKALSLDGSSAVAVTLEEGWKDATPGTRRIVLVEAEESISVPNGFSFDLPADTPEIKVTRDATNARQLAVNVKVAAGAMVICIR